MAERLGESRRLKREPTEEDLKQARCVRESALEMGQWIMDKNMLERKLHTLSLPELMDFAVAALGGYIKQKSKERSGELNDPLPEFDV